MKPQEIELTTTSKMFTYETMAREIDKVDDPEVLRDLAKSYCQTLSETTGDTCNDWKYGIDIIHDLKL